MTKINAAEYARIAAFYYKNMKEEIEIEVYCSGCENSDMAARTDIEAVGWLITDAVVLCPLCNFG